MIYIDRIIVDVFFQRIIYETDCEVEKPRFFKIKFIKIQIKIIKSIIKNVKNFVTNQTFNLFYYQKDRRDGCE